MTSSSNRLRLADYCLRVWDNRPPPDAGAEAISLALDALRVGVVPSLEALALDEATRRAWVEAGRRLEHERAQRRALALTAPGLRYEDAIHAQADEVSAIEAAVHANDRKLEAIRGGLL